VSYGMSTATCPRQKRGEGDVDHADGDGSCSDHLPKSLRFQFAEFQLI